MIERSCSDQAYVNSYLARSMYRHDADEAGILLGCGLALGVWHQFIPFQPSSLVTLEALGAFLYRGCLSTT